MSSRDDLRIERLELIERLRSEGIEPYATSYSRTHTAGQLQSQYAELAAGQETTDEVRVCGRITNERNGWMFVDLTDESGRIQLFFHSDSLPESDFQRLRQLRRGDFIGVRGTTRRTARGELSVRGGEITILSLGLTPLPGRRDEFTDPDARQRNRPLDMICNRDVLERLRTRSRVVSRLRRFLEDRGFLEVETPVLQSQVGGGDARPFVTHHNTLDQEMHLRIATELHLKRLIVGGLERVFEIGRVFRNEGLSPRHNPEFTSLELYQAYGDYLQLMDFTEELVVDVVRSVHGADSIAYQGLTLNFSRPWRRVSMEQAVCEATNTALTLLDDLPAFRLRANELGAQMPDTAARGDIVSRLFDLHVEDNLIQPTFITDYPVEVSPLARRHRSRPDLTERFEFFVFGRELGNGYSELVDPQDQRGRFEDQCRRHQDDELGRMDEDFLSALELGMPPTMGLGIGIDRLAMLVTNTAFIRDVIAFPTLRTVV